MGPGDNQGDGGVLRGMLGAVPRADFIERHYLKLPFAMAGGCRHLTPLGGWDALDRLLRQPEVDLLVGREGSRRAGEPPRSAAEARAVLAEGFTVGVRRAHRGDPALAELAAGFRREFASPIDVHLYATPAGAPGLGWHYDAEDVFVLQTAGSKEWWLRKNTVNPWPLVETLPANMRHEREIMPASRCLLAEGDWLYIPGGYWHRTQAHEESLSLSVGVLSAVALDALDALRPRLLESLLWRQRLPTPGEASEMSAEERLRQYRELFAELGRDLAARMADDSFAPAFLAGRSTGQGGGEG